MPIAFRTLGFVGFASAISGFTALAQIVQFDDFSSVSDLSLVGSAQQVGSALRLTSMSEIQSGAAWFSRPLPVAQGFSSTFSFRFSGSLNGMSADGITFVVQSSSPNAIGGNGGGLGYSGIGNSLAVEFDNFQNTQFGDPQGHHVGILLGGDVAHGRGPVAEVPGGFVDGSLHTANVTYSGGEIRVSLDGAATPIVSMQADLGSLLTLENGSAYLGFTGGTGAGAQLQDITAWQVTPVPEPATSAVVVGFGLLGFTGWRRARRTVVGARENSL